MVQHRLSAGSKLLSIFSMVVLICGLGASWVFANDRSDRERGEGKTIVLIGTHAEGTVGLGTPTQRTQHHERSREPKPVQR
jgi:hypothetical protein